MEKGVADTGGASDPNAPNALKNHTSGNGDTAKSMHDDAIAKAHNENTAKDQASPIITPKTDNDN